MIQAPRNLKQIGLAIITEVAARLDRCVRSKITSVSKLVVLLGLLQRPFPAFLFDENGIFYSNKLCAIKSMIYNTNYKLDCLNNTRELISRDWLLILSIGFIISPFSSIFLEDCLEKSPPLGSKELQICSTCFRIHVRCQNSHVLQNSCQMSEFARASEFVPGVRIRTCFRIRFEKWRLCPPAL